jgi:hypothetical protein
MKAKLGELSLNKEQKYHLHFAISKAYEDFGDIKNCYYNLNLANNLKKEVINFNIKDQIKLFDNIKLSFSTIKNSAILKNYSHKQKIIFILGMPRSGTTLVEQILSSHPDVYGAGELLYLEKIITENFLINKKINKQKIIDLQNTSSEKIISEYLKFFEIYNFDENTIIDKTPQNFKWIGFIKIFFPDAKIIICQRNAKDNCVSLFKNNFPSSMMNWAFNQEEIAEYYNQYFKLISFWKNKIPNDIYNLNYEKLINDNKGEIDKLLKFCNLDLSEKCYDFTRFSKTPIKTVSVSQANKPIYKDSINSFNMYQNFLQKMFNKINII